MGATFPVYSPVMSLSELAISGSSGLAKPQTDHAWLPCAGWMPMLHSVKESSLPWCFAWKSPRVSPHHSPEAADFALAANTWCLYSSSLQNAVSHDRLLLGLDGSPTPRHGVQQHLYPVHMLRPYDQSFIPGIVLCRGPEQVRWGGGRDKGLRC